jgi:hypothetical protein
LLAPPSALHVNPINKVIILRKLRKKSYQSRKAAICGLLQHAVKFFAQVNRLVLRAFGSARADRFTV